MKRKTKTLVRIDSFEKKKKDESFGSNQGCLVKNVKQIA